MEVSRSDVPTTLPPVLDTVVRRPPPVTAPDEGCHVGLDVDTLAVVSTRKTVAVFTTHWSLLGTPQSFCLGSGGETSGLYPRLIRTVQYGKNGTNQIRGIGSRVRV